VKSLLVVWLVAAHQLGIYLASWIVLHSYKFANSLLMGIKSLNIIKFLIITATKKTEIPLFGAGFCFFRWVYPPPKKTLLCIASQHTDAQYWYSKSVRQSVRPLHSGIVWKQLNAFSSPHRSRIILVLSASNIFTKFWLGHPLWGC